MIELIIRYLHFVSIILLASMLLAENILLARKVAKKEFKKLLVIDSIYGLSAITTLIAGLFLWLWVGKPSGFYSSNPIFHTKLGLFVLVAILSIIPTIFFLQNRNTNHQELEVPAHIILIVRLEAVLLFVIPLFAVLMARGVGIT